jgi:hypothetical protein
MPIGNVQAPAVSPIAAAGVQSVAQIQRSPWVAPVLDLIAIDAKRGVAARTFAFADNAKVDSWLFAYHTGKAKEMNLVTPPPDGQKLQLTLANHVSGHSGQADQFARTNEAWTININGPTGQQTIHTTTGGSAANPVYSFAKDVEIDVSKPGNYTISAAPDLSAGVGGYIEGRLYNLHVGQENFFKPTEPPDNFRPDPNTTYPYPIREADDLAWSIRSQGLG